MSIRRQKGRKAKTTSNRMIEILQYSLLLLSNGTERETRRKRNKNDGQFFKS